MTHRNARLAGAQDIDAQDTADDGVNAQDPYGQDRHYYLNDGENDRSGSGYDTDRGYYGPNIESGRRDVHNRIKRDG